MTVGELQQALAKLAPEDVDLPVMISPETDDWWTEVTGVRRTYMGDHHSGWTPKGLFVERRADDEGATPAIVLEGGV